MDWTGEPTPRHWKTIRPPLSILKRADTIEGKGKHQMPELQLCIHCNKPIDPQLEQFVVLNKDASKDLWQYAHAQCHDQEATVA
jgi:hypothetical protein